MTMIMNHFLSVNGMPFLSGFLGVGWDNKYQKWIVRLQIDKRSIYGGRFVDPLAAAKARDTLARSFPDKIIKLNFP